MIADAKQATSILVDKSGTCEDAVSFIITVNLLSLLIVTFLDPDVRDPEDPIPGTPEGVQVCEMGPQKRYDMWYMVHVPLCYRQRWRVERQYVPHMDAETLRSEEG
jgi:hypothetical protein